MVGVDKFKGELGYYVSLAAGSLDTFFGLCLLRFSGGLPILVGLLVIACAFLIQMKLRILGGAAVVGSTFAWWFYFLGGGSVANFRWIVIYGGFSPSALMGYVGLALGIIGGVLGITGK